MALFGMEIKKRRKSSVGGFHAAYIDQKTSRKRGKSMGLGRTLGTAMSFIIGGLLCYTALHYIPAFLNSSRILAVSGLEGSIPKILSRNDKRGVLTPYIDHLTLKRAYLLAGQEIEVEFDLPKNARLDLYIRQCRPMPVLEVFDCQVINEQNIAITQSNGTRRFSVSEKGFYEFSDRVTQSGNKAEDFRVIWSRA